MSPEFRAIRMEREQWMERRRRERMWRAVKAAIVILAMLAAFGFAGAADLADRRANLAGSYDAGWWTHDAPAWLLDACEGKE